MKRLSQLAEDGQLFAGPMADPDRGTACTDQTRSCPALKHSFKTGLEADTPARRDKARAGSRCPPLCDRDLPRRARHGAGYWARLAAPSLFAVDGAPASPPPRGRCALDVGRPARPFRPLPCRRLVWGAPSQPFARGPARSPRKDALFVAWPRSMLSLGFFGGQIIIWRACWFLLGGNLDYGSKKH